MSFYKFLQISIVFLIIFAWVFTGFPQIWQNPRIPPKIQEAKALDNASGDGIIIYGVSGNTTPQWRTYNGSTNSFGAETGTVTGGTGLNFVVRTSPTKQEAVAGYVNSSGVLQVMCYNGTSWTNEWSVTVGGTGTTRRFDIAYETNSGDVMVAYGNNGANMGYRTKAGSTGCGAANWSSASTFTPARTTGTINWVRLEGSPVSTSNVIFAAWEDSTGALSAQSWSGTAWNANEPSAAFSTNIENTGTTGDSLSFDIAFESQTGNLIIVFSPNNTSPNSCTAGTNCIQYSRYTTSWSAVAGIPTVADPATNVDLASNPNTNEIVLGAIDNTSADLSHAYWSGSAWTGKANQDTATAAPVAGTKLVACGWLISGATTRSVCTYNDSGTTNIGWVVGNGGTFTTQTDVTPTPAFGNPQKWYDIQTDPFNKDRLIFSLSDVNNDLFAKRLIMDATPTFTWTDADGGAALQANLPGAIASPFSFAYWRFIPTPTFNQSAYRLFNNLDSTDVGTALAAQDTAATLGSTGAAFRLRMLLHVGTNQLAISGQTFKLQFAQQSGTCDTGFVGETYADVTAATVIAYNNNATPADGATLTGTDGLTHGSDGIVNQTYEELNNFTNSVSAIPSDQDGKWDFSLIDNGASADTTYCFRVVKSDGTVLDTYTVIPQITTAPPPKVSVSGTLYADEGTTAITDSGIAIKLAVATGTPGVFATTTCAGCGGVWRIEGITASQFGVGVPFIAFVDGAAATRAVTLTKASSTASGANITGLDLYQNRVIARHEATSGTTTRIADFAAYDFDNNASIQYVANGGTLEILKDQELHIWTGTKFEALGAVTLHGNASSTTDGSFHIDDNASTTISSTLSVAGNFTVDPGGIFNGSSAGVLFTASTTGKTISVPSTNANFASTTFNGAGGAWSFGSPATTTGTFTITAGTVTAPGSDNTLYIGGDWSNSGNFTDNGGKVVLYSSSAQVLRGGMVGAANDFNTLEFSGAGAKTFLNNASTSAFSVNSGSGAVAISGRLLSVAGTFTNNSTFTTDATSKVYFAGSGNISGTLTGSSALGDVEILASRTFTNNASTTALTIASGATLTAPSLLTVAGAYSNNGTFTHNSGKVYFSGSGSISGNLAGSSAFNNVEVLASRTFSSNASTTDLTIVSGATLTAPSLLTISGNYTNNGDFADGGGTVYFAGTSAQILAGQMTGSTDDFASVEFLGAGTKTFNANASTSAFTINAGSGAVSAAGRLVTIGGTFTNNSTFTTDATSKLYFTGSGNIAGNLTGASNGLRDIDILGSRAFTANASTTNLIIRSGGSLTAPSGLLSISGNYTNNGTFTNNSGTTTFNGTAAQSLAGTMTGASAFYNLEIANSSASTTFSGAASTTNNFYVYTPNAKIEFAAGATSTLRNLLINGSSGNEIRLWSATPGTQWNLHSTGTRSISFANVKDSNACSEAGNIDATNGTNIDGGNNTCWNLAAAAATIESVSNQVFEINQATTTASQFTITGGSGLNAINAADDLRIAIATSSVNMRWDTSTSTFPVTFGGTACPNPNSSSCKVATTTTSFEGGNSVVLIDVTTNFGAGETLTVSGLRLGSFNAVVASSTAFGLFLNGTSDQSFNASTTAKFVAIKGKDTLAGHDVGQETNKFEIGSATSITNAELFVFKLTPSGESVSRGPITFNLSNVQGFNSSHITNAAIIPDYNSNGAVDAGETSIAGAGSVSISGNSGSIIFSSVFSTSTARNYILRADVSGVNAGDELTISLSPSGITASGTVSLQTINPAGSVSSVTHRKPSGTGGDVGGAAPPGVGQQSGGGGGGGGEVEPPPPPPGGGSGGGGGGGGGDVRLQPSRFFAGFFETLSDIARLLSLLR